MAKVKISEFSATPGNNTDIDGINIAENCAPSGINDAIRELMSQLKDWQSGTSNDPMVIGSSGSLTLSYGTANGVPYLNGSKVLTSGSALTFNGTNFDSTGAITAGTQLVVSAPQSTDGNIRLYNTTTRVSGNKYGVRFADSSFETNASIYAEQSGAGNNAASLVFGVSAGAGGIQLTSAVERMRLDSSGNLGLGVTPSVWDSVFKAIDTSTTASIFSAATNNNFGMNVYYNSGYKYKTTNNAAYIRITSGGAFEWNTAPSGTAGNAITFTQAMTLDASGNLLVGTTTGAFHRLVKSNASDYACAITNTSATTPFGLAVSLSAASPNDATRLLLQCEDSTQTRAQIRSNGGLANYSANNVNISDERTKTDIFDAGNYLAKICAIPIRTFKYKDQTDELLNLGVIAQEVEVVAPELVDVSGFGATPEDGVPLKAIYQTDLQYALMKCIQEQQALIAILQADVAALKAAA